MARSMECADVCAFNQTKKDTKIAVSEWVSYDHDLTNYSHSSCHRPGLFLFSEQSHALWELPQ